MPKEKWQLIFHPTTVKQFRKIDTKTRQRIYNYLGAVTASGNPRSKGKAMSGDQKSFWRYRIGEYRMVCRIQDEKVTVVIVKVGHRKDVYRGHQPLL